MSDRSDITNFLNVKAGETLTVEQVKAMTMAVKAGHLRLEQFRQIADIARSFNSVAVETARFLIATVESAGKVKESGLESLRAIVNSLEKIATSTDDVVTKNKVIDCLMQIADKIEAADKRSDKFFYTLAMLAISAVATVIARRPTQIG